MKTNIQRFGKLNDYGESDDGKRAFIVDDRDHDTKRIHIEIDTDDCDLRHARAFKQALIELWNSQP